MEDLYNYNQYFDNAHFYLKKSCNIFMGMTTESKKENTLMVWNMVILKIVKN